MPAQFYLPELPFDPASFGPALSKDTFDMHHGGHHKAYVDKLNELSEKEGYADSDLISIIRETADTDPEEVSEQVSAGDIFVNAAQHFNHAFYWKSLATDGGAPAGDLLEAINKSFGSVDKLKEEMVKEGVGHFASGWVWLIADGDELEVISTHDAQTPVIDEDLKPILVLDVWEHAYYIDHKRARKAYLDAVVAKHLNWDFAAKAYAADDISELGLGIDNKAAVDA